jgi:hypothetical protein
MVEIPRTEVHEIPDITPCWKQATSHSARVTLIIASVCFRHQKHEILLQLTECQYSIVFSRLHCASGRGYACVRIIFLQRRRVKLAPMAKACNGEAPFRISSPTTVLTGGFRSSWSFHTNTAIVSQTTLPFFSSNLLFHNYSTIGHLSTYIPLKVI